MTKLILTQDIVIKVGTVFEFAPTNRGGKSNFEADVAFGNNFTGYLVAQNHQDAFASGFFRCEHNYVKSSNGGLRSGLATYVCDTCGDETEADVS